MSKVQKWGREESIIWPPRGFYYTYGAIFLAVLVAGFLVYVRFTLGLVRWKNTTFLTTSAPIRLG